MIDLKEIRKKIDEIDDSILNLFEQRMIHSKEVADFKIKTGKKVFDRERELSKLSVLSNKASNDFNRHGIEELFSQIMSISRKLQYQLLAEKNILEDLSFEKVKEIKKLSANVVFQGVPGAYSQMAMFQYFGEEIESTNVGTFCEAMETIKEGKAEYAVLPIENSSAGSVTDIYDLLVEFDNYIVGEQIIKVEHALLGLPESTISDIKTIYSHPQGLMQCAKFLEEHETWQQISIANTAIAAKKVLDDQDKTQGAIASKTAAKFFHLKVLREHLNFSNSNETRFIIIANKKMFLHDAKKISICFELPHESGTLYNILSHFIFNNLSMTKIESRPLQGRNWEYRFFIDFEGNLSDSAVKNALLGLKEEAINLKVLGNY